MKRFTSKTQRVGEYGEKICTKWLVENNFKILERNFTTKSGEIDIICEKNNSLHFIEVKSTFQRKIVSHETITEYSNELRNKDQYNPAENVTKDKIRKCFITISEYKRVRNVSHETSSQLDVYLVYIDPMNIKHKLERIENVFNK